MLNLDSFRKAVTSLDTIAVRTEDDVVMSAVDDILKKGLKSGVIQHFEFTYELAWKYIKRWLENNISATCVDGVARRELFRLAQESRLLDDVEQWMRYHRARNLTSHTYDEEIAHEVYQTAILFIPSVKDLLSRLEAHND